MENLFKNSRRYLRMKAAPILLPAKLKISLRFLNFRPGLAPMFHKEYHFVLQ